MAATLRSVQLWTTIVVLVLAPLCFGSVDLVWVVVWAILLSISALCGLATPLGNGQAGIMFGFLALCGVYALAAIIQIIPDAIPQLNDPNWARANELLGLDLLPRISSRAEFPPLAAGHFLLFATAFLNGFFIGTSRHGSFTVIWCARYAILLCAVYGLVALKLTPDMVLWAPKLAYRGSLTATFINHNTAATFFGAGAILWFCSAFSTLQSFRFSSIRLMLLINSSEHLGSKIVGRSGCALLCFFALLLTGSRGGLICSCLGLFVAIALIIAAGQSRLRWPFFVSAGGAAAVGFALLSQMGRIGSHGLLDDGRRSIYEFCLEAIRQRPWLGAGAGTFADLLPSLRSGNFYSWGVWDYAHSTILEIAVEMGVPVAVMVVVAALASLFFLARGAIRSEGRDRSALAAIAGIAVLSYLHAMIDFSLQIPGYLIPFGILLGCGLARASSTERAVFKPQRGLAARI